MNPEAPQSENGKDQSKDFHPPFGEQDLSDDLFAEYLVRVGEGEDIDVAQFLSARGFSEVAVETFRKELKGYESYRQLLQARTFDGKQVGQYRLVKEIGRGGMGRVYLAEDTKRKRQVAIKLLAAFEPGNLQAQERFRREYEMVTTLHHPNIVPMFDAGEADGFRFYTMEYIPGFTLDQLIARIKGRDIAQIRAEDVGEAVQGKGPLWRGSYFDWTCWVIGAVGEALAHAHRRRIIHRDIKPSNILLTPSGRPYLFDFGLACGTRGTRITRTGEVLGTPAYMAPEQIEGGKLPTDQRTDVYGLGVTLYEMLTLNTPFQGDTAQEVAHRILLDQPVPPRRYNPAIPAALEAICLTAIAKDPARRYPTVRAMLQDLRNFVAYRPVQARNRVFSERLATFAKKNPLVAAAGFAAIALAVPLLWIGGKLRAESRVQQTAAVSELLRKGVESYAMGHWPAADEFFGQANRINPSDPLAIALRGLNRNRGLQERSAGLEDYRLAIDLEPENKGVGALRAAALGDPSPVHALSESTHPDELATKAWDHCIEGLVQLTLNNDATRAAEQFSLALAKDRRHHLSVLLRGMSYASLGLWSDARIDLTAYTFLQPEDPVGYLFLSRSLAQLSRIKEANAALDQALGLIRGNHTDWGYLESSLDLFKVRAAMPSEYAGKGAPAPASTRSTHSQ